MNDSLFARLSTFTLLLLSGLIFYALQPSASASESPMQRFVCAARIDCGAPGLPSTQDLPSVSTPIVVSRTVAAARDRCLTDHASAYRRLVKTVDEITPTSVLNAGRGCSIVSEAFRAE